MATSMTIAVDLAKTVFEIAVSDGHGKIIERQRRTAPSSVGSFRTGKRAPWS